MAFSLSRNAKLYVSTSQTIGGMYETNTWEIPVLDGFSFSAATATQEIEISEAGLTPSRGQQIFTTAIEPVNWSIQTYIRPRWIVPDSVVDCVERVLWEALMAKPDSNTIGTEASGLATTLAAGSLDGGMIADFDQSNSNELLQLSFVFNLGTNAAPEWYHIPGVVVDTAEIDFAIDAIASISWGGFGDSIVKVSGADATTLGTLQNNPYNLQETGSPSATAGYAQAPQGQQACIRNKLSTVFLQGANTPYNKEYTIALTGGSLSISNNITFLTPENLGVVNQPCGHITGQRQINGTMTAYLKSAANETADLMADVQSVTSADPLSFALDIFVGGADPGTGPYTYPVVQLSMPTAHIVIPTINIEDVVSVEIPFTALPTTGGANDPSATNELEIHYYADES